MEALFDAGALVRWLHLLTAVAYAGLALALDWVLGPLLLGPRGEALRPHLAPGVVRLLRWTGALAWLTGMAYGLGWLSRQDPEGTWHWLTATTRGQWLALGGVLATISVFAAWFVAGPCWEQLAARPARQGAADPDAARFQRGATLGTRLAAALVLPLVFAMGAARHLGDTGADLPTSFPVAAAAVVGAGLALGVLLGTVVSALARHTGGD